MNTANQNSILIESLKNLIEKGNAHASFEDVVADIPLDQLTVTPKLLPYNIWQLTEHIRIGQWDIVEFCVNPDHQSPKWPDEYWVDGNVQVTKTQWEQSLQQIRDDRNRFFQLLTEKGIDFYTPLPQGSGQTLLKEALLIADHTAYHTGEIIVIRRLLNIWKQS